MLVLDCSVAMAFVFSEEESAYTEQVRAALEQEEILVPSIFHYEAANVLITHARRSHAPEKAVAEALIALESLPDRVIEWRHLHAPAQLARTHGLTAYDAAYLAVALQEGAPLATQDKALRKAALAEGMLFSEKG